MVIINGNIHPVDAPVIANGFVAISGRKITAVGAMADLPPGDLGEVVDAGGGWVTPGYIDAHCHLGVFGDSLGFEGEDGNEATAPATPHLRGVDAVNPLDRGFQEARAAGVCTVVTGPGSANPIGGQLVALKTAGTWADEMVVRAPIAMKMALGENPKGVYHQRKESPTTRMATAAIIREELRLTQDYLAKQEKATLEGNDGPAYDGKREALVPVLCGKLPIHIHAHRADDIATALRLQAEFGFNCVIVHGTEGYLMAPALAQTGVSVITGPNLTHRSKPELSGQSLDNPALLAAAGVPVAICTDHPETPIQYLTLCAALAVRGGMTVTDALAAITLSPAKILGLDNTLGSLTPGKVADVVVTPGDPFDMLQIPSVVVMAGRRVV